MQTPAHAAEPGETLTQVLAAIKDDQGITETEIAKRIDTHVSTVNNWIRGRAMPRQEALLKLTETFPDYKRRLFAATGKKTPAPLTPDVREEVLRGLDRLTEEQQQVVLTTVKVLGDSNEGKV